jgi:hypothetical protein
MASNPFLSVIAAELESASHLLLVELVALFAGEFTRRGCEDAANFLTRGLQAYAQCITARGPERGNGVAGAGDNGAAV